MGDISVFLRITRVSHRSTDIIRGEIEWIEFLSDKDLSVSRPVRSDEGQLVEEIIMTDEDKYTVVCFEAARGLRISEADYNAKLFRLMGAFMGKCITPRNIMNNHLSNPKDRVVRGSGSYCNL